MRRRRHREDEEADINMTPMLDIVFIMLIFFIVTASFVKETGLDINRPAAASASSKENASILIALSDSGQVWIDRRQVDVRAVRANIERMRAENPQAGVVIQADKNSKNGLLVDVMDAAEQAGVENISLAADVEE
jgi:biopolymer transport protein ExbD